MKKYLFSFLTFSLLMIANVKAETCSLEKQVTINNEAGLVSVNAEPFEYQYSSTVEDTGEVSEFTGYLGSINIYNLTENLYAVISNGSAKKTVNYSADTNGVNKVSTGSMNVLKNYTVSIYPSDTKCGKTSLREFQVTIPIENPYYKMQICTENPDYFYCTQFLNIENISRDDFTKGINEYINKKKSEEEEKRHEGILDTATTFMKKHWLVILISALLIASATGVYIYIKNKKKKEHIV